MISHDATKFVESKGNGRALLAGKLETRVHLREELGKTTSSFDVFYGTFSRSFSMELQQLEVIEDAALAEIGGGVDGNGY